MSKRKTSDEESDEEFVTWSPYGNSFKETKKAFVIVLYVESSIRDGVGIVPIVWDANMHDGPESFSSREEAKKFLDELFDGGTTYTVFGYEIKQIQLVKMVKRKDRDEESITNSELAYQKASRTYKKKNKLNE